MFASSPRDLICPKSIFLILGAVYFPSYLYKIHLQFHFFFQYHVRTVASLPDTLIYIIRVTVLAPHQTEHVDMHVNNKSHYYVLFDTENSHEI